LAAGGADLMLGVLGGLGPGATVHFLDRLVEVTPAYKDQQHIETLVYNDPTVPDRTEAILGDGISPEHQLVENAKLLDEAGCEVIVIDSNTTHYYYDVITVTVDADVPHMMRLVAEELECRELESVGVLTTEPAIEIGLYDDVAPEVVYPEDIDTLMSAMYSYKAGEQVRAEQQYVEGVESVPDHVDGYVVGCTDFSALSWPLDKPTVDALDVLAEWCVERFAQ
jgi:aspartate racemase